MVISIALLTILGIIVLTILSSRTITPHPTHSGPVGPTPSLKHKESPSLGPSSCPWSNGCNKANSLSPAGVHDPGAVGLEQRATGDTYTEKGDFGPDTDGHTGGARGGGGHGGGHGGGGHGGGHGGGGHGGGGHGGGGHGGGGHGGGGHGGGGHGGGGGFAPWMGNYAAMKAGVDAKHSWKQVLEHARRHRRSQRHRKQTHK